MPAPCLFVVLPVLGSTEANNTRAIPSDGDLVCLKMKASQDGESGRSSLTARFAYVTRMDDLRKSKNRDIAVHSQLSKFACEQRVGIHVYPLITLQDRI